ncbi:MAG: type I phosphomannose isomerase catalytic subunit [Candidatus Methanoglobus sp.]
MELPSFLFQATENLVERPWGGEWISLMKGFRKKGIGESWEFSAHPSNPSQVFLKKGSVKLTELFVEARKEILGDLADKYTAFPLLVKLIDVSGRLDLHVHPSAKVAESFGETEVEKQKAWIVLKGTIYVGLSENLTQENFEEIIGDEKLLLEKLNRFESGIYDTFVIPPGVLHTAENSRMVEISTNSELTYGLKDEKAKKAIKIDRTQDFEVRGKKGKVETEFFTAEVLDVAGRLDFTINTFNLLLCLEGYALLRSEKGVADLQKGYSCLVPASTGSYAIQSEKAKVLRIIPK